MFDQGVFEYVFGLVLGYLGPIVTVIVGVLAGPAVIRAVWDAITGRK